MFAMGGIDVGFAIIAGVLFVIAIQLHEIIKLLKNKRYFGIF